MRITDAVWTATALLHQEHPEASDFRVQEIVSRAVSEGLVGGFRPGLQPHASWHCVANKKPNGGRSRMLFETIRGRRRLFRTGDDFHPDRTDEIRPEKSALPAKYQPLIDWYEDVYGKKTAPSRTHSGIALVGSAGAVIIPDSLRKDLGIEKGTRLSVRREKDRIVFQSLSEELITRLRGSCKGWGSLVEAREREHRDERY